MRALSRRSVLCSLAVPAVGIPFGIRELGQPDARLLALSRQFELMLHLFATDRKQSYSYKNW